MLFAWTILDLVFLILDLYFCFVLSQFWSFIFSMKIVHFPSIYYHVIIHIILWFSIASLVIMSPYLLISVNLFLFSSVLLKIWPFDVF